MTVNSQGIGKGAGRKRKAHKKSRLGCRNCKLRSVKCDETRPECKNCTSFRVSCNYNANAPDLEMLVGGVANLKSVEKAPPSPNDINLSKLDSLARLFPFTLTNDNSLYELDEKSLGRLERFQTRTMFQVGYLKETQAFQYQILGLAFEHPYLMHVVQTITAIHDRYLSASPARQTTPEVFHWSHAISLFNRKLSTRLQPQDRDPLFVTAALFGVVSFCIFDASTPEEAWPLKPPTHSDLEWLRLCEGKSTIFKIAVSLKPDEEILAIRDLALGSDNDSLVSTPKDFGFEPSLAPLLQLCDLDDSSTAESNPYHEGLQSLVPLLQIECNRTTCPRYFTWITNIQPYLRSLIEQKDPRALLLLAYWYAKICHSAWWIVRRAWFECQATCIYLERYHADDTVIMDLLWFPKMQCGLLTGEGMYFCG